MLKINTLAYWTAMGAVILALGSYYLWQLRATGEPFDWVHQQNGYYNYPGRAFAHGHLDLPLDPSPRLIAASNPWDPALAETDKMHDMAFFHGRYYLYHGAGPAVLLLRSMAAAHRARHAGAVRDVRAVLRRVPVFVRGVDAVARVRRRGQILAEAIRTYEPAHPDKIVPLLVKARPIVAAIADPLAKIKLKELDETIALCTGLWVEAQAHQPGLSPEGP